MFEYTFSMHKIQTREPVSKPCTAPHTCLVRLSTLAVWLVIGLKIETGEKTTHLIWFYYPLFKCIRFKPQSLTLLLKLPHRRARAAVPKPASPPAWTHTMGPGRYVFGTACKFENIWLTEWLLVRTRTNSRRRQNSKWGRHQRTHAINCTVSKNIRSIS